MNRDFHVERMRLAREFERVRSIAQTLERRKQDSFLDQQLSFWSESARFCITELEIWVGEGDRVKCQETIDRAVICLNRLNQLMH